MGESEKILEDVIKWGTAAAVLLFVANLVNKNRDQIGAITQTTLTNIQNAPQWLLGQ